MSVSNHACRSPIGHVGLLLGMSVSDGSQMKHVEVSDGPSIRYVSHRWVCDQACCYPMGFESGMLVSDGSPIGLRE